MSVGTHSADEVAGHPAMRRRAAGLSALADVCRACPVLRQCGGGLTAHRYRSTTGFANPSVYCADLKGLITSMNEHPYATRPGDLDDLPGDVLDQVASGYGDAATIAVLAEAQFTINRVLISEIADALVGDVPDLLLRLEAEMPAEFRAVMSHPFVRSWAVTCLAAGPGTLPPRDHLSVLLAAVAVRAGSPVRLDVPIRDGRLHLPTLGTVLLPHGVTSAEITATPQGFGVRWDGGDLGVEEKTAETPYWRPIRHIEADGFGIAVEDSDPYRDCHEHPATSLLSPAEFRCWATMLPAALTQVSEYAPELADGMRAGLRAVTPLTEAPGGTLLSATSRHAFGDIGVTYTSDPEALAVLLVHEFQHTKLAAVMDVLELVAAPPDDLVVVDWRPDPRPVDGALQGAYAHLGMADFWRSRASRDPGSRAAATAYRRYRRWTATAISRLRTEERLTDNGMRFVSRMAGTLTGWQ